MRETFGEEDTSCDFSFRNPPLGCRIVLVALVLSGAGSLGGTMVALFVGKPLICNIVGLLLGGLAGAVMEGWPNLAHECRDLDKNYLGEHPAKEKGYETDIDGREWI